MFNKVIRSYKRQCDLVFKKTNFIYFSVLIQPKLRESEKKYG